MLNKRTSWQVTRSVWHALLMREMLSRTTGDRFAWFWVIVEPAAMIVVMVSVRTLIGRGGHIGGASSLPWLICGLFGFFLFRENMMRSMGAVNANKGLFTYRQVKPIDPVLIRCYLEGMLKSFIFILFILLGLLLDIDLLADSPLEAIFVWFSLWILGLGAGLILSALSTLVPEIGRIVSILQIPLLLLSGVLLPLNFLPHDLQQYILLNPIVHGLESLRLSFFSSYRSMEGISMSYLWFWALSLNVIGLLLHLRYSMRLRAQ